MPRILVVGAGVIGGACALALRRDGHEVTLIDRQEPGGGCSFGPAGLVSPSSCAPLATPGVARQVPRWLLDRSGRLHIRAAYLPHLAPWLLRFLRTADPATVRATRGALAALHRDAFAGWRRLLGGQLSASLLRRAGQLFVFETEAAYARARGGFLLRRELGGGACEDLDAGAVRALEPALARRFSRGVLLPDQGHTVDPGRLARSLAELLLAEGGRLARAEVHGFARDPGGRLRGLCTTAGDMPAEAVVLAAGAWSARLAARLGDRVPLESERGYHMHLPEPGVALARPVVNGEHSFAATPMETSLRLAGTVEFAGLEAPPDFRRAERLLAHARRMFPGLAADGARPWLGHRPSLPDSRPVIDRASQERSVFYAFGHAHTGLTGAPATAEAVASLVAGRPAPFDLAPYRLSRFRGLLARAA